MTRPTKCYRDLKGQAYTRKEYVRKGYPNVPEGLQKMTYGKTNRFDFPAKVCLVALCDGQVSDKALESVRVTVNKELRVLGETKYRLQMKAYPFHVNREHGMIGVVKAERFSKGMRLCQTPNSIVICEDGIKRANEVKRGNLIWSDGEFIEVEKVKELNYYGKIIQLRVRSSPLQELTETHPIFIKRKIKYQNDSHYQREYNIDNFGDIEPDWILAESLKKNDYVCFKKFLESDYSNYNENLLMLCGWFLAEGSTYKLYNRWYISFALSLNDEPEEIVNLLEKLGLKSRVKNRKTSYEVITLVSKETDKLAKFLRKNIGTKSFNKRIPEFMNGTNLDLWLPNYIKGDGSKYHDGITQIKTSSPKIASQLFLILLNKGYKTFLKIEEPLNNWTKHRIFCLSTIFPSIKRKIGFEKDNEFWLRVTEIKQIPYKGKVIGIKTSNGLYSLPYLTHNSFGKSTFRSARIKKGAELFEIGINDEAISFHMAKKVCEMAIKKLPLKWKIHFEGVSMQSVLANPILPKRIKESAKGGRALIKREIPQPQVGK